MIALTAAEIAAATGGVLRGAAATEPALVVSGPVVVDSRDDVTGGLFVALPGEHVDGHDYAAVAVAGGAALVLAARDVVGAGGDVLPSIVVTDVEKALGDLARVVLERLREVALEPGGSDLRVVGITGSVGKPTTKDLLAQL